MMTTRVGIGRKLRYLLCLLFILLSFPFYSMIASLLKSYFNIIVLSCQVFFGSLVYRAYCNAIRSEKERFVLWIINCNGVCLALFFDSRLQEEALGKSSVNSTFKWLGEHDPSRQGLRFETEH